MDNKEPDKEPEEYVGKIKKELLVTGLQFKKNKIDTKGELSANDLNAFTNIMKGVLYAEQVELQRAGLRATELSGVTTDLSEESKAKLDEIARLLSGENPK